MTNTPDAPPDDATTPSAMNSHGDDATMATPTRGRSAKPKGPEFTEITVNFRFTALERNDHVAPEVLHLHWIQIAQEAFDTGVQIYNNKGALMPKVDTMRWTPAQHSKNYTVHRHSQGIGSFKSDKSSGKPTKATPSAYIIHRVRISTSFKELKNESRIAAFLRENNVYLTEHRWTEDVWNTTQIGFIIGLDPVFYSPAQAHEKMSKAISTKAPGKSIPKFAMAFCTPNVKLSNTSVRTKAYAIEVEKEDGSAMINLMKQVCKDTHEFVPFQMKARHKEAFVRIICQQTHLLSQLRTIIIKNVGSQAMFYLHDHIAAIPGVRDIMPHSKNETDGKYRVQVKQEDFKAIRANLAINLPDWYEQYVSPDAQQQNHFPDTPCVAPIPSDGYSSGEDSYHAGSVCSALSYTPSLNDDAQPSYEETMASYFPNSKTVSSEAGSDVSKQSARKLYSQITAKVPPPPSSVTASVTPDEGMISDLRSSRSEVADLRRQLEQVQSTKEKELAEIRREAATAKHEAEMRALEQKQAMETQVTQQRLEFERQLFEQRQELELESKKNQAALEAKLQSQIDQAFQRRPINSPSPVSDPVSIPPALASLLENQSQQLTMLTQMMATMSQRDSVMSPAPTPQVPTPQAQTTSGLKRSSAEIIDLTMEDTGTRNASGSNMGGFPSDRTKKHDSKETPSSKTRDPQPIGLPHGMQIPPTPASVTTPMSVLTPPGRTTPPPLESYHPPSIHRSPISWAAAGDSPISNLAMRPEYQFGPEASMTSEIAEAEVPLTQPPEMDESLYSDDDQLQDTQATLLNEPSRLSDDSHQRAAIRQQNPTTADDSFQENTTCHGQTKPGDQDTQDQDHEL